MRPASEGEPGAGPLSDRLVRRATPRGTDIVLVAGTSQHLLRTLKPGADRVWLGTFSKARGGFPAARPREQPDLDHGSEGESDRSDVGTARQWRR